MCATSRSPEDAQCSQDRDWSSLLSKDRRCSPLSWSYASRDSGQQEPGVPEMMRQLSDGPCVVPICSEMSRLSRSLEIPIWLIFVLCRSQRAALPELDRGLKSWCYNPLHANPTASSRNCGSCKPFRYRPQSFGQHLSNRHRQLAGCVYWRTTLCWFDASSTLSLLRAYPGNAWQVLLSRLLLAFDSPASHGGILTCLLDLRFPAP